jgi:hypothetical protein
LPASSKRATTITLAAIATAPNRRRRVACRPRDAVPRPAASPQTQEQSADSSAWPCPGSVAMENATTKLAYWHAPPPGVVPKKGTQSPRQMADTDGTQRTRRNLATSGCRGENDACPYLAGKGGRQFESAMLHP